MFEQQGTAQNRFAILALTEVQGDVHQDDDQQEDVAEQTYKKKSGKKAPALTLRRACATYEGSVEGCVFTTVRGVTGYYEDARQAAKKNSPITARRMPLPNNPDRVLPRSGGAR